MYYYMLHYVLKIWCTFFQVYRSIISESELPSILLQINFKNIPLRGISSEIKTNFAILSKMWVAK